MGVPWSALAYVILSDEEITNHCEKTEWRKPKATLEFPAASEVGQAAVIIGQTGKANAHEHLPPCWFFYSQPTSGSAVIRAKYWVTQQQCCEICLTHNRPTGSVWMCSYKARGEKGLLWWVAETRVLLSLKPQRMKPSSRTTAWARDNPVPLTPLWLHLPDYKKTTRCFV